MEWLGDSLAFTSALGSANGRRWSCGTPVLPQASIVSAPGPWLACGKNTTCDTHSFVLFSCAWGLILQVAGVIYVCVCVGTAADDVAKSRKVHKHPRLSWEAHFYSLIELSQFHLVNEGVGGSLPFRQLQANNHIETWGLEAVGGGWGHNLYTGTSVLSPPLWLASCSWSGATAPPYVECLQRLASLLRPQAAAMCVYLRFKRPVTRQHLPH